MKKITYRNGIPLSLMVSLLILLIPQGVFAYEAAPVGITKQATFITEKSAKLNGQANPSDMPDAYTWFEWGISGRTDIVYETPHQSLRGKNVLIDRNATINGLAPSTQYFFRQVVENGRGKDIGQTTYFTTKPLKTATPSLVIVETKSPSAITDTSVTLKGYVSPHGDSRTKAWFEWGFTQNLENRTPSVSAPSNAGPIEARLKDLTPGTAYFYRAVAENSAGKTVGVTRIFLTTGIAPAVEQPAPQAAPVVENDTVARTTTTSGSTNGTGLASQDANNSGDSNYGYPGVSSGNRPGDFFSALFKKKNTGTSTTTNGTNQIAGVAESGPLGGFWGNLTGKRTVEVVIEKIGPEKVVAHTPVEYRITYTYKEAKTATNAKLKIILPADVIYIGDNTNNELLLEEGVGGERTYLLPIGQLEKGSTRTLSVLGMTTGAANGFPDARARLEYDGQNGTQVIAAVVGSTGGTASTVTTRGSDKDSGSILPSSFFGWLIYILLIVLSIIGIRKAKIYYQKRKEIIEARESEEDRMKLGRLLAETDGTPQGA